MRTGERLDSTRRTEYYHHLFRRLFAQPKTLKAGGLWYTKMCQMRQNWASSQQKSDQLLTSCPKSEASAPPLGHIFGSDPQLCTLVPQRSPEIA